MGETSRDYYLKIAAQMWHGSSYEQVLTLFRERKPHYTNNNLDVLILPAELVHILDDTAQLLRQVDGVLRSRQAIANIVMNYKLNKKA